GRQPAVFAALARVIGPEAESPDLPVEVVAGDEEAVEPVDRPVFAAVGAGRAIEPWDVPQDIWVTVTDCLADLPSGPRQGPVAAGLDLLAREATGKKLAAVSRVQGEVMEQAFVGSTAALDGCDLVADRRGRVGPHRWRACGVAPCEAMNRSAALGGLAGID